MVKRGERGNQILWGSVYAMKFIRLIGGWTLFTEWCLLSHRESHIESPREKSWPLKNSHFNTFSDCYIILLNNSTWNSFPFFSSSKCMGPFSQLMMVILLTPFNCQREYFLFAALKGDAYTAWAMILIDTLTFNKIYQP